MTTTPGATPSGAVRLWRRWRGTLLIATANTAVAVTIALVTAVLALVVEDLLPINGPSRLSGPRPLVLLGATVLLVAAILWRSATHRHTGTLFYLRMLDLTMDDWHVHAVDLASRRHMALRPITRWVDLPGHTQAGLIDVARPCTEITRELRAAVLANPEGTGCTIAPNLLWPMALAIGAELPPVNDLNFLELPGAHADRENKELVFTLPTQPAPPGLVRETLTIENLITMPGHQPSDGRLGLLLAFGPNAQNIDPQRVFTPFGVGEYYRIRPSWIGADLAALTPDCFTGTQLATLAHALTDYLAQLKNATADRELVLAAALPKTLALAVGFGLAQTRTRFFTGTHLLHYDDRTHGYLPMRVHFSQPAHPSGTVGG